MDIGLQNIIIQLVSQYKSSKLGLLCMALVAIPISYCLASCVVL